MKIVRSKRNKDPRKIRNFYVALAICLISIGATVLTTYNSFVDYNTQKIQSQSSKKSPKEANKNVKGVPKKEDKPAEKDSKKENTKDKKRSMKEKSANNEQNSEETKNSESKKQINPVENNSQSVLVVYPCSKEIIKDYSIEDPVYSKTLNDWRIHNGVDLKTNDGDKIKAIADGVVKEIYKDVFLGKTIVISHDNGLMTFYSGLADTVFVEGGDRVKSGQDIGSISEVPGETLDGSHLHFSVKKDDKFINPLEILPK